ncbi:MFS transporter, SP family, sugar:H+ symporter [Fonsecaea pedrosoi]|nr:MFS transporter, SP family, sugar:H+ symporter [Fonsecaea pedrosoi]
MVSNKDRAAITWYNILIVSFVTIAAAGYAWTNAIIGTTLGQPSFLKYFHLDTASNATDLISTMNGLFQAGGFFGALAAGPVADRWGRKFCLGAAAVITIVSNALLAGSVHVAMFISMEPYLRRSFWNIYTELYTAFRFFAGFAAFFTLTVVTIWMSEVVPPAVRGTVMEMLTVGFVVGYVGASWCGFGFYFWKSDNGSEWRPPLAIGCAFPLIFLAGLRWVPESPRYLVAKDRHEEARTVLERLHRGKDPADVSFAHAELYQIQKQAAIDRTLQTSWAAMFKRPSYRRRCFYAMGYIVITQCIGELVINNYSPSLYAGLGYGPVKQLLYSSAWITQSVGFVVIAMILIDRFPRPQYMAFGVLFSEVCLSIYTAIIATYGETLENKAALRAAVAILFIYLFPVIVFLDGDQSRHCYLLPYQHYLASISANGIQVSFDTVWNDEARANDDLLGRNIGWKYYLCLIIPGTIGGLILWNYFPDTKGVPLEELAALFGDEDEVAIYQSEIEVNENTGEVEEHLREPKAAQTVYVESTA